MSKSPILLNNSSQWQLPPSHTHTRTPREAGGGEKLSFTMLSGSSSYPGYFQAEKGSKFQSLCWAQLWTGTILWDICVCCWDWSPLNQKESVFPYPSPGNKNGMGGNAQTCWDGLQHWNRQEAVTTKPKWSPVAPEHCQGAEGEQRIQRRCTEWR